MGKLPYPERDGQTHWESCFREPKHHNCAVAEVDRLLTRLAEVEAENGRLRKALEYYADHDGAGKQFMVCHAVDREPVESVHDMGHHARAALAQTKEPSDDG